MISIDTDDTRKYYFAIICTSLGRSSKKFMLILFFVHTHECNKVVFLISDSEHINHLINICWCIVWVIASSNMCMIISSRRPIYTCCNQRIKRSVIVSLNVVFYSYYRIFGWDLDDQFKANRQLQQEWWKHF